MEVHTGGVTQQHIEQLVLQLQQEGVLDDQFQQLMMLQDETNPDFIAELVQLYLEDSFGKINKIEAILTTPTPDFNELDGLAHQFKGSSASLGAQMLAQLCVKLRECCQAQTVQGCVVLHRQIQAAYTLLRAKLDLFMQLEARRKLADAGDC